MVGAEGSFGSELASWETLALGLNSAGIEGRVFCVAFVALDAEDMDEPGVGSAVADNEVMEPFLGVWGWFWMGEEEVEDASDDDDPERAEATVATLVFGGNGASRGCSKRLSKDERDLMVVTVACAAVMVVAVATEAVDARAGVVRCGDPERAGC